jgi:hypothetical protein
MCERWQIDTQKPRARQKVPPTKQAESHVYDRKREQEKDRLSLRARMRASALRVGHLLSTVVFGSCPTTRIAQGIRPHAIPLQMHIWVRTFAEVCRCVTRD